VDGGGGFRSGRGSNLPFLSLQPVEHNLFYWYWYWFIKLFHSALIINTLLFKSYFLQFQIFFLQTFLSFIFFFILSNLSLQEWMPWQTEWIFFCGHLFLFFSDGSLTRAGVEPGPPWQMVAAIPLCHCDSCYDYFHRPIVWTTYRNTPGIKFGGKLWCWHPGKNVSNIFMNWRKCIIFGFYLAIIIIDWNTEVSCAKTIDLWLYHLIKALCKVEHWVGPIWITLTTLHHSMWIPKVTYLIFTKQ